MIADLTLHLDALAVDPGDPITGVVRWSATVESLEVLLRWKTSGKGDTDTEIVARAPLVIADQACEARFALTAPEQPVSFSGTLISLTYYVRVEDTAGGVFETEIVIAPGGKEVRLAGA
ncbi:MAG: hypothetical protein H0T42_32030 [Deltaproteobacteria bacterium]|nr:hypothetical protein [Deltaproteobacteria bacterium]